MNKTYNLEKETILTVLVPADRLSFSNENNDNRSIYNDDDDDSSSAIGSIYDGNTWKNITSSRSVTSADYSVAESTTSRASFGTMINKDGGGSTYMSYREIVEDIEKRAKNKKPPPDYMTTIDKLPSSSVSWDGKKKKQVKIRPYCPLKELPQPLDGNFKSRMRGKSEP